MSDWSDMRQVRGTFSVGAMPPAEPSSPGRADDLAAIASRYAAMPGTPARFDPLPDFERDDETAAALAAYQAGATMVLLGKALDFALAGVQLAAHHVPLSFGAMEVGVRGNDVTLTGWVDEQYAEHFAGRSHCSPGLQLRRARIVELTPEIKVVEVTEALLTELSATDSPRLDGTTFAVGPVAGRRYWPDPSWETAERFTRSEAGAFRLALPGRVEVA